MSSAALQSAPHHQSTAYASSHSPPSRDSYQSRRPSSRKASGTAAPPFMTDAVPTSAAHYSDYPPNSMPPVAPPRTSSSQQSGSARKAAYPTDKNTNSPRRGQADASGRSSRGDANGASDTQRSKRQDGSSRQANSRDGRGAETSMPIRTHEPSTPKSSRDHPDSTAHASPADVSTRPVLAEYQGSPRPDDDAAPPPIASNDGQRGGRSRHDHSRNNRGTSKFGDFILGNTIGEGEFGKVKLGWKQDSNVQVRPGMANGSTIPRLTTTILLGCHQINQKRQRRQQPVAVSKDPPRGHHPARLAAP
jgi:protein-serine/threonine kinase